MNSPFVALDHGPAVDMWSVGVLAYVMVGGFVPFDGSDNNELFANIEAARYKFPLPEFDDKTELAKGFISKLLQLDPNVSPISSLDPNPFPS